MTRRCKFAPQSKVGTVIVYSPKWKIYMHLYHRDAIRIIESWLCPNISASEISVPGYL